MAKKSFLKSTITFFSSAFIANLLYHNYCMKKNNNVSDGSYYSWKYGDIYYEKCGVGDPLLLIHSLSPERSSCEWSAVISYLSSKFTVYAIDLPGCGRSDKDIDKYTEYLYSEAITSFVKDVICAPCVVIASEMSSRLPLVSSHFDDSLFKKIILLDPQNIIRPSYTNTFRYYYSKVVGLPVIGSILYDIRFSAVTLRNIYGLRYFSNPHRVMSSFIEKCVFNAQFGGGRGRYLYESMLSGIYGYDIPEDVFKVSVPTVVVRYSHRIRNKRFLKMNEKTQEYVYCDKGFLPQVENPKALSIYLYNTIFS